MYLCNYLLLNTSDPFKYPETQQDNAMIIIILLINLNKLIVLHITNDVQLRTKHFIQ